jgi:hypothetical protein
VSLTRICAGPRSELLVDHRVSPTSSTRLTRVASSRSTQLRPQAIGLGIQAFRRAIDDVVGKVAAEEAAKLDRQSPS